MPPSRAFLAEMIGTFALTFVGCSAIVMTAAVPGGAGGLVTVALAHGLILGVMITAAMHISGGQLNPAVSIGLALIGKQSVGQAACFIASQLTGAIVAAFLVKATFGDLAVAGGTTLAVDEVRLGATLGGLGLGAGSVFVLEVIATFFLMYAVMGSAVDPRGVGKTAAVGGFAIGLTVTAGILCIGPATGASMNPARSFGPALAIGAWDMHWVYWLAPIFGASLAALAYHHTFGSSADDG